MRVFASDDCQKLFFFLPLFLPLFLLFLLLPILLILFNHIATTTISSTPRSRRSSPSSGHNFRIIWQTHGGNARTTLYFPFV